MLLLLIMFLPWNVQAKRTLGWDEIFFPSKYNRTLASDKVFFHFWTFKETVSWDFDLGFITILTRLGSLKYFCIWFEFYIATVYVCAKNSALSLTLLSQKWFMKFFNGFYSNFKEVCSFSKFSKMLLLKLILTDDSWIKSYL